MVGDANLQNLRSHWYWQTRCNTVRSIRQQNLRFYELITAKTLKSGQALANNLKLSDQRVLDRSVCSFATVLARANCYGEQGQ
eukprot:310527-Rhodomonas_salina.1